MIVIPAIDIKGGRCVRLRQGKMDEETVYSEDPVEVAKRWEEAGASLIHLVDLDAAVEGSPVNFDTIENIVSSIHRGVQIGGGIRDEETAERYLSLDGVRRVIIGTAAYEKPELVSSLAKKYPGRIAVGIDAKDGMVAIKGWVDVTTKDAIELAKEFEGCGVSCIIYTDISKDGMLEGPNVGAMREMVAAVDIPVVASGGVSSMDDITALSRDCGNLTGVIVGKALYAGNVDLAEAIKHNS
ncbi:MAG: 1-(5-phosphoribosyl)-5-[(5-phosphoribosylamino)methylideneamino]imidazole-4-carboxamide isomerase [Thermodesulfobacteriota bacterium]